MTLDAWMTKEGMTLAGLADKAEISVTTAHRLRRGERLPSKEVAERLFGLSGGQVTANDFYDQPAAAE
jgi:transcriptional regulator with XRE-family HTH domain